MESRIEPRFPTDEAAQVQVVRDNPVTVGCRITDISALGFQLEVTQPLTVGETILVTTQGAHMLAVVRNCTEVDGTFRVGVERADEWVAPTNLGATSLIGRPKLKAPVGSLRSAALYQMFKKESVKTDAAKKHLAKKNAPKKDVAKSDGLEKNVEPKAKPKRGVGAAVTIGITLGALAVAGFAVPWQSWPNLLKLANAKVSQQQPASPAKPSAEASSTDNSSKVPQEQTPVAGVSETAAQQTSSNEAKASQQEAQTTQIKPSDGAKELTAGTIRPVQIATAPAVAAPAAAAPNSALAPQSGVFQQPAKSLSIKASGMSWVTVCADGQKVFSKLFEAGSAEEVKFSKQASLRSGNSGALELSAGTNPIGKMGSWGVVRTLHITPEGFDLGSSAPPACR